MRINEEKVSEKFKAEGWTALRNGWPDYLLVRLDGDGKLEVKGLEIKCAGDTLSGPQLAMQTALLSAGIKTVVGKG
jgi:hypothetical protein